MKKSKEIIGYLKWKHNNEKEWHGQEVTDDDVDRIIAYAEKQGYTNEEMIMQLYREEEL